MSPATATKLQREPSTANSGENRLTGGLSSDSQKSDSGRIEKSGTRRQNRANSKTDFHARLENSNYDYVSQIARRYNVSLAKVLNAILRSKPVPDDFLLRCLDNGRRSYAYFEIDGEPICIPCFLWEPMTPAEQLRWEQYNATKVVVNTARHKGLLVKQPCEVCGSTFKISAHHDDYSKPLEVRWLCRQHHEIADKERRRREMRKLIVANL